MRLALCCIAKNEELYINDFINWYLNHGVDKIYIYDNNEIDKPLKIDNDKVKIINVRGQSGKCFQQEIYTKFYNEYKDTFEWCLFVDIDEFLMYDSNIKYLLELPKYQPYEQIRIRWLVFNDNDLIIRDMNKPVYKIFKTPITNSLNRNLVNKGNLEKQGKSIVKGHLDNVKFVSPHYASYLNGNPRLSCLPNGKGCYYRVVIDKYDNCNLFINHYMTKSLSEFINQKLNRNDAVFNNKIKLDYYWRINKKTKEKLDYLKEKGLI